MVFKFVNISPAHPSSYFNKFLLPFLLKTQQCCQPVAAERKRVIQRQFQDDLLLDWVPVAFYLSSMDCWKHIHPKRIRPFHFAHLLSFLISG